MITDGFHLATLVEGGFLLFIPSILLLLSLLIRLWVAAANAPPQRRWLPLAVLVYLTGQIFLAGFFNTGFYGKVPNLTFWLLFGAIVAIDRATVRGVEPPRSKALSSIASTGASGRVPNALRLPDDASVVKVATGSDVGQ